MKCDRQKIVEYANSALDTREMLDFEEHLKACQDCSKNLQKITKINDLLSAWSEKNELGKDFDNKLVNKAVSMMEKQDMKKAILRPIWRVAVGLQVCW